MAVAARQELPHDVVLYAARWCILQHVAKDVDVLLGRMHLGDLDFITMLKVVASSDASALAVGLGLMLRLPSIERRIENPELQWALRTVLDGEALAILSTGSQIRARAIAAAATIFFASFSLAHANEMHEVSAEEGEAQQSALVRSALSSVLAWRARHGAPLASRRCFSSLQARMRCPNCRRSFAWRACGTCSSTCSTSSRRRGTTGAS